MQKKDLSQDDIGAEVHTAYLVGKRRCRLSHGANPEEIGSGSGQEEATPKANSKLGIFREHSSAQTASRITTQFMSVRNYSMTPALERDSKTKAKAEEKLARTQIARTEKS